MKKIKLLAILLCAIAPAYAQQDLCDYTAEADAADIDGFELLMGDPLNSCEGYSVTFTSFLNAIQTTGIDAIAIDADGDGTNNVRMNGTTLEFDPSDDGTPEATLTNGGALTLTGALTLSEYLLFGGGRTIRAAATDVLCYGETSGTSVCTNNSANQFLAASDWSIGFSPDTSPYGGDGDVLLTRIGAAHLRVSGATTSTGAVLRVEPLATAPATCTIGDFYVDTSGAACACSATNTWTNMHATGSCT